jgi:hypothetical protein
MVKYKLVQQSTKLKICFVGNTCQTNQRQLEYYSSWQPRKAPVDVNILRWIPWLLVIHPLIWLGPKLYFNVSTNFIHDNVAGGPVWSTTPFTFNSIIAPLRAVHASWGLGGTNCTIYDNKYLMSEETGKNSRAVMFSV